MHGIHACVLGGNEAPSKLHCSCTGSGYTLVEGAVEQRCQRLLLKRSMLADHTLKQGVAVKTHF